MPANLPPNPWSQIAAWGAAGIFVLGFFSSAVGAWTGPVLSVWFVGAQRPWRGFVWMVGINWLPTVAMHWRNAGIAGPAQRLEYLAWMLLGIVLSVLPYTFHRLISSRLPGALSTLPLPLAATVCQVLVLPWLPGSVAGTLTLSRTPTGGSALTFLAAVFGVAAIAFMTHWFAATLLWVWNLEFRRSKIAAGGGAFLAVFGVAIGFGLGRWYGGEPLPAMLPEGAKLAWICLVGCAVLTVWAAVSQSRRRSWAERPEAVARLKSPISGEPLELSVDHNQEALVSAAGERFPIRDEIPNFLNPGDLTGDNRKYNHVYETIGGFYDDIQRIFCGLKGFDRDAYFRSYMSLLDVKTGDLVLETSVGTGLNFKYLPSGVKLSGLDLSPEMLVNCQTNLHRWEMQADLYLGNAESLPFADSSFDVVFHVGGINFFNDRAKAIREMIRVARPGSLLLIADETEEHVKNVYEKTPGGLFKDRGGPVIAPVDLVPAEMLDIHLEPLKDGMFYALTFRKPAAM